MFEDMAVLQANSEDSHPAGDPVAAMLDRGRLGLEELCEDYVHNETVQTLMRRVEMIGDDGILAQLDNPDTAPEAGEAILHLSNGKRLSLFNPMATGMPGKEIPAEILTAKFFDCATRSRSRAEAESLHRRLLNLENLERADLLGTG